MARLLPLALIALALLAALAPGALADEGGGSGTGRATAPLGFRLEGGRVTGSRVAFQYLPGAGPIADFAYLTGDGDHPEAEVVFGAVLVPGTWPATPVIADNLFLADGGAANVTVHDGPAAILEVGVRQPLAVTFVLGPGAEVEPEEVPAAGAHSVFLDKPLKAAILTAEGLLTVDGPRVVATLAGPGSVVFRAATKEGPGGSEGEDRGVDVGISQGRVGAEVSVGLLGEQPQVDAVHYRRDARLEVLRVARNRLELRVRGAEAQGTVLLVRLDPSVVAVARPEAISVTLDGRAVARGTVPDVLFAQGSSPDDARFAVLARGPGVALLAYIPQLSPGGSLLAIQAFSPTDIIIDPAAAAAMAVGAAVVAASALLVFRRRR